jgi:hypothetical protein
MIEIRQLPLPINHSEEDLLAAVCAKLKITASDIIHLSKHQRAIDARHQRVQFRYTLAVQVVNEPHVLNQIKDDKDISLTSAALYTPPYSTLSQESTQQPLSSFSAQELSAHTHRVIVVGSGPCGLFAALLLARAGWRPLVLERGKEAGERARDVTGYWNRNWPLNPNSNVQFGEGGAGTFSDGKLYTQIRDPENRIPWILQEMVNAGAPDDILLKARPHVGTDRLIRVIKHIRNEIIALGGMIRFNSHVQDIHIQNQNVQSIQLNTGEKFHANHYILAIGHSSRDTFEQLHRQGVQLEAKSFSVGVRIEHSQQKVDQSYYGKDAGHPLLGSAPYKFAVGTSTGRTAYSFCMCPGGLVVAAASEPDRLVTNGMSSYARNESNANAGFMVEIKPEDFPHNHEDPLCGITFQRELETKAFVAGGNNHHAPAQRLEDFLTNQPTAKQGALKPSYKPGVTWTNLYPLLPPIVAKTLQEAIPLLAKKLPFFADPDAILTGFETRSSSPVRITRDPHTFASLNTFNLYPSGEGAGYAGGIISAAADGMRVAEAIIQQSNKH